MPDPLEMRVNLKVYTGEILESVMNRLGIDTEQTIVFSVWELLPYPAKAREYHDTTVREILDDQLSGTLLKYRINKKKQLEIYIPRNN